jgi:hypothetical protein
MANAIRASASAAIGDPDLGVALISSLRACDQQ